MALPYEDSRSSPPPAGSPAASGSTGAGGFSGPFLSSLLGNASFGGGDQYSANPFMQRIRRRMQPLQPRAPMLGGGQPMGRAPMLGGATGPAAQQPKSFFSPIPGLGGGVDPNQPGGANYKWHPDDPFWAPNPTKPFESFQEMASWLVREFGRGGGYGQMGDPRITNMLRQQAIEDAGAQQRSARLGLQYRNDIDPSTYGFQALMSDLGGQDRTSRAMNEAQLQQALSAQDFFRKLFGQTLGADYQREQQVRGLEANRGGGFDWGGALGGIGKILGGL